MTLPAAISARLEGLGSEWELDFQEPLVGGWNSVVLACAAPTGPAVLKLTLEPDVVAVEERALRHWGPEAAVRVLVCDATRGALLLERLHPATPIPASETDIVAEALARLHRILPCKGPSRGLPTSTPTPSSASSRCGDALRVPFPPGSRSCRRCLAGRARVG